MATVTVVDNNGCTHSASVSIDVYEQPTTDLVIAPLSQCVDPQAAAVFTLDATATLPGFGATVADPVA